MGREIGERKSGRDRNRKEGSGERYDGCGREAQIAREREREREREVGRDGGREGKGEREREREKEGERERGREGEREVGREGEGERGRDEAMRVVYLVKDDGVGF